jgi:hypothetical protein
MAHDKVDQITSIEESTAFQKGCLSIFNSFATPIFTRDVLQWAGQLQFVSPERMQQILFSSTLTLPPLRFDFGLRNLHAKLIALIFEIDYAIDQSGIDPEMVLHEGRVADIVRDYFNRLDDKAAQPIFASLKDSVVDSKKELDQAKVQTPEEFLEIGYRTIAIPTITKLVSVYTNEPVNEEYLKLGSQIVRIANDLVSRKKDSEENTKNIFNLFNREKVLPIYHQKLEEFRKFRPKTKIEKYISSVVSLSLKLYNRKDFELTPSDLLRSMIF